MENCCISGQQKAACHRYSEHFMGVDSQAICHFRANHLMFKLLRENHAPTPGAINVEPQIVLSAKLPNLKERVVRSEHSCPCASIHIKWGISLSLCSEDGCLQFYKSIFGPFDQ